MSWRLFPTSGQHVELFPEWDFTRDDRKVQSEHRTRLGKRYAYRWGGYVKFKSSLTFADSSTAALVNSWWSTNTKLLFQDQQDVSQVFSVMLVNDSTPLGQYVRPYVTLYAGVIELEGY